MGSITKRTAEASPPNGRAQHLDGAGVRDRSVTAASMRSVTRTIPVASERHTHFVDITDAVREVVAESGVTDGLAVVCSLHTTARIHVNEHEPLLLTDLVAMLERLVPQGAAYSHDDFSVRTVNVTPGERINGHSHARGLFVPVSEHLPVTDGALMLGRWQRVFMVELDGPQARQVVVKVLGT